MDSTLRIVLVCCIVEYFTKFFSTIFGGWGFDPIMADTVDVNRALEISGYVGVMLCGAFPMVALIKNYLSKPLNWVGSKFGLSVDATTGILAASTNIIALFAMVKNIAPEDKVKCLAYSVCAAFLIGDHLAFSANFQPTLILPMMAGKFFAGILAVWLATKIAVPRIKGAEAVDKPA
jgi:ethanolamine transporter